MKTPQAKELALRLLRAESEAEVIEILDAAGYWKDPAVWRLYGDKEGNFAQVGNQQSIPEAALVEKIVNCVDSRLMSECLIAGIDPVSDKAPKNIRDAVAMFFEGRRAEDDEAGSLANWSAQQRTLESRAITIAATGDRPARGRKSRGMCLTIADLGEGQSPLRLPRTILSLNAKNKQRIRFVQGKFNMGGSGALRFCGQNGLQLVISKRHPALAATESDDPSVEQWAVTVVRREEPSNKSGEPIHSEFTYLAPVGAHENPRGGSVLGFRSATLPIMPEHDEAYVRQVEWGTAIKLYEYETTVGQSNVLMGDGLLFALERLMPEIALPIRLHECRGYKGEKERSFETPIAGLVVRLEEGRGDNLESSFPLSARLYISGTKMTARIYAFKEERAGTYLKDEGVIFQINGQAHGYLPKSLFSRPKRVGLPRLKDSLLLLVDCSSLSATQREDLFMSSRDRLSKKSIRFEVEGEIMDMLRSNPVLKALQQARREIDIESRLSEERPLEEVLGKVLKASPTLKTLFLAGQRLSKPFESGAQGGSGTNGNGKGGGSKRTHDGDKPFLGKRHPTYFRTKGIEYGKLFRRSCEEGRKVRIAFETDVENEYFNRATDRGSFELEVVDSDKLVSVSSGNVTLDNGEAHLSMSLPSEVVIGDTFVIQVTVDDPTLVEPFINLIELRVLAKQKKKSGPSNKKKKPGAGAGNEGKGLGISLPKIVPVKENDENWNRYKFTRATSTHVISDPVYVGGKQQINHTFYINMHNTSLRTEMKYSKQDARLLEAKFKYGNVLLGIAMLHESEEDAKVRNGESGYDENERPIDERIKAVTAAVAPVLLPMIDQLSGLDESALEEVTVVGEDV